jgi:hypothetical protein
MVVHTRLASRHTSILMKVHVDCLPVILDVMREVVLKEVPSTLYLGLSEFVKVMTANFDPKCNRSPQEENSANPKAWHHNMTQVYVKMQIRSVTNNGIDLLTINLIRTSNKRNNESS